jgi:hypothetical protein
VTRFHSGKVRAPLADLATESDRPHARAPLAALLWPEQPDAAALRRSKSPGRRSNGCLMPPPDAAQVTWQARSADPGDLARAAAKIPGQVARERPVVELIYELYSVNRLAVRGHVRLKPYAAHYQS